jgi:hypothetical protein
MSYCCDSPDYILDTGDQIYMKTIQNKKKQGRFKNMLLTFDEIPNVLEIRKNNCVDPYKHQNI